MKTKNKKIFYILLFFIILILAFAVRIYNIKNTPGGIYPDEAVNGMDALKAKESGNYLWFYPDNNGREGLYINLISFSYNIFNISILGLKFPSIVLGTLTVLGIFLLTLELFRSYKLALIASYLSGISFWLINFSRIGFRAIMLPAILTFSFYFLFRGLRTKKIWNFIVSGFIFGLGLHTYIAFRIAPIILIVIFLALIISQKKVVQTYWKHGLTFIIFAIISAAPIILTFANHPEFVSSRSGSISILSPEVNKGDLIGTFGKSFGMSLAKYNFWGDQNWRHNFPPYPVLNPLVGVTFLFGLIYFILKFFHSLFNRFKGIRDQKFVTYSFLLSWFLLMLAPEFMTSEGLPHALRAIGTLPVVYIIAAYPVVYILHRKSIKNNPSKKQFFAYFTIATLLFIGTFNVVKYHYYWANSPKQQGSFNANLMNISDYLKTLPQENEKIIIVESMERIPIKLFNHNSPNINYVYPGEISKFIKNQKLDLENSVFIMPAKRNEVIELLQNKLNVNLNMETHQDKFNNTFYTLK